MNRLWLHLGAIFLLLFSSAAFGITPPAQPCCGPGGAQYAHAEVEKSSYREGAERFWIYEPSSPKPERAPLVVFHHGWSGTNPRLYGAWIQHIVRRGNIVVFPTYQRPDKRYYPSEKFTPHAIQAVKEAIAILQSGEHVRPDLARFAILGHSAGGMITANMAALAKEAGLPEPKAIMPVQPGKTRSKLGFELVRMEDMRKVPTNTLVLVLVGASDYLASDEDGTRIWKETTQVPWDRKSLVVFHSDSHGKPNLKASHFSPLAEDPTYHDPLGTRKNFFGQKKEKIRFPPDALDFFGYWKLFDALCDTAFYGKNPDLALGNPAERRFMGKWSDGTPVKELEIRQKP